MAKKKTHEELIKQINVKTEFADKLYKKMRSERYGTTFCCPLELDAITLDNTLCEWDFSKISKLPEVYAKEILQDPVHGSCKAPAIYNPVTGRCEDIIPATETGSSQITYVDPIPDTGTAIPVERANNYDYGRDCPIIGNYINAWQDGGLGVPENVGASAGAGGTGSGGIWEGYNCDEEPPNWWVSYDGTPGGADYNASNPNVTEISYVNALGVSPTGGWEQGTVYYYTQVFYNSVPGKKLQVFLAGDNAFGLTINGTDEILTNSLYGGGSYNAIKWNVLNANPSGNPFGSLPEDLGECCNSVVRLGDGSGPTGWGKLPSSRGFIYPLELIVGCNIITFSGANYSNGGGMLAFALYDNSSDEVHESTSRGDLSELISSDNIANLYTASGLTWTCAPPGVLFTGSGDTCPQCQITTNTNGWECPEGYTLTATSPGQDPECVLSTGSSSPCDTETLIIDVVNQNGDVMPYYIIVFNGGNYTTDENGHLEIVVEDASVNTIHTFNLCECFVTSGGCAIQKVDITVTEPDIITCTTAIPLCDCVPPSFHSEIWAEPVMTLLFTDANYGAGNEITAITYTLEWRLEGTTGWTSIPGLLSNAIGSIAGGMNLGTPTAYGTYEYRIKAICEDSESDWSATNEFTVSEHIEDPVYGCTDPLAANYNPLATIGNPDAGKCEYFGCTDPLALNYNPLATIDDGSCDYPDPGERLVGCMDPAYNEYNPLALISDPSMCLTLVSTGNIYGCTDATACNYDASANTDDGSCCGNPVQFGLITGQIALNMPYNPSVNAGYGDPTYPPTYIIGATGYIGPGEWLLSYPLQGEVTDQYGSAISVNGDGTEIMYGIPGFKDASLDKQGKVESYIYNSVNDTWDPQAYSPDVGPSNGALDAVANFGYTELSTDGSIVAISGRGYYGTQTEEGGIKIFERQPGGTWLQKGITLVSPSPTAYGHFGETMSLSGDGLTIAVGSPGGGTNYFGGAVYTFKWDGANYTPIASGTFNGAIQDYIGIALALSGDGLTLVIGHNQSFASTPAPQKAELYSWNGSAWVTKGTIPKPAGTGNCFAENVTINYAGDKVGIGWPESGSSNKGTIRVYEHVALLTWSLVGNPLEGVWANEQLGGGTQGGTRMRMNKSGDMIVGTGKSGNQLVGFKWEMNQYYLTEFPASATGSKSQSVGLSDDGQTFVFGDQYWDRPAYGGGIALQSNAGRAYVYKKWNTGIACPGCTDSTAANYNPCAATDDGSCTYYTYIPDTNFQAVLIASYGVTFPITDHCLTTDISGITTLIAINNISDFTGLEDFAALDILLAYGNNLTGTLDLTANTLLTVVTLSDNQLTNIITTGLNLLYSFSANSNLLTTLDISTNTALTTVALTDNQLTTLDVSTNTLLTNLALQENNITSLSVTTNTALLSLQVHDNQLTSIDISTNTALTSFKCYTNQLTSLNTSTNVALIYLECYDNLLTSLNLSTNVSLFSVKVQDQGVSNDSLLYFNIKNGSNGSISTGDFIATGNSNLSCIDVDDIAWSTTNWTNIDATTSYSLFCPPSMALYTYIPDANFQAKLTASYGIAFPVANYCLTSTINVLTNIDVTGQSIADMTGIEDFTAVTELICYNNSLTGIDVSQNTALTILNVGSNPITSLNVSTNTALVTLAAAYSQLSSIDLSNLTVLDYFDCRNSLFNSSLDVSNNTALTSLNCRNNTLTSLNIKNTNNINMPAVNFRALGNSLTTITCDTPATATTTYTVAAGCIDSGVTFV